MSKPIDLAQTLSAITMTHQSLLGRVLTPFQLTHLQYSVLCTLVGRDYPITITKLTERMGIEQPATTKIIRKFAQMGLVHVETSQADKRIKFVQATPQGRKVHLEIERAMQPAYEHLVNDLGNGASEWLMRDLSRLNSRIGDYLEKQELAAY